MATTTPILWSFPKSYNSSPWNKIWDTFYIRATLTRSHFFVIMPKTLVLLLLVQVLYIRFDWNFCSLMQSWKNARGAGVRLLARVLVSVVKKNLSYNIIKKSPYLSHIYIARSFRVRSKFCLELNNTFKSCPSMNQFFFMTRLYVLLLYYANPRGWAKNESTRAKNDCCCCCCSDWEK